jgi:thiol-disulfide isomerase/thioredoxin
VEVLNMSRRLIGRRVVVLLVCGTLALVATRSGFLTGEEQKPKETTAAKPAAGDESKPLVVPDGKPDELLKFIDKIGQEEPPAGLAPDAMKKFVEPRLRAMAEAGAKILAAKPTEEQALGAARARLSALSGLERMEDAGAAKQIEGLPAELKAAGQPKLARAVQGVLFQRQLQQVMSSGGEDAKTGEQVKAIVGQVATFLGEGPLERSDVNLAMRTAMAVEQLGQDKLAAEAYGAFGKVLGKSEDKLIARFGAKMEGAARRLGLVGGPMEVDGTLIDGKKLDWAKYKDKTVLVMFWATWCGPCKTELPNVKELYKQYHAKGFDVVGISCDDDRKALEEFVKETEIPWAVTFSNDPEAAGMENPMANRYGVIGVPTMILVGRDGKVVSLAARGANLARDLEKIYGPAEKPAGTLQLKPLERKSDQTKG